MRIEDVVNINDDDDGIESGSDRAQFDESLQAEDFEDKDLDHQIAFASLRRVSCFAGGKQMLHHICIEGSSHGR